MSGSWVNIFYEYFIKSVHVLFPCSTISLEVCKCYTEPFIWNSWYDYDSFLNSWIHQQCKSTVCIRDIPNTVLRRAHSFITHFSLRNKMLCILTPEYYVLFGEQGSCALDIWLSYLFLILLLCTSEIVCSFPRFLTVNFIGTKRVSKGKK
jgi:hypothetical protein